MADILGRVGVGVALLGKPGTNVEVKTVAICWPKLEPVNDDPESPENYEEIFMTVACAKELILNLQEVVDSIVQGKAFSDED